MYKGAASIPFNILMEEKTRLRPSDFRKNELAISIEILDILKVLFLSA